jgi:DNA-binding transcriptional ArsR family regulator
VAAVIADPSRAAILDALMDGTARRASELALRAGVASSTASGHLARLVAGGLIVCQSQGRERRYRIAAPAVADAIEALARIASPVEVRSLRTAERAAAVRTARTCYDHLAGRLGVGLTEALVERGALVARDGSYDVTAAGARTLGSLGVDVAAVRSGRRSFARACLDWTERRPHLAGALGAALADALLARGWIERRPNDRGLRVTPTGTHELGALGVELDSPGHARASG